MRGKIYAIEELNRALPLVRAIVADVVRTWLRLSDQLRQLGLRSAPGEALDPRDLPWETRDLVDEFHGYVRELEELGIFLQSPSAGLVEAYGELGGEIVYFTWKLGEDRVGFWHGLFGSHRERRPVLSAV